jgi:hypothetical protein
MPTRTVTMIDIPEGYLYGFPMEFDINWKTQSLFEWLLSKGVPNDVANNVGYYRSWTKNYTEPFLHITKQSN